VVAEHALERPRDGAVWAGNERVAWAEEKVERPIAEPLDDFEP